jgi:hypothetical protein
MSLTKINLNMLQTPASGVLAGLNSFVSHNDSFVIGANINSTSESTLFVNGLSARGKIRGDASELTNIGIAFNTQMYMNSPLSGTPTAPTAPTPSYNKIIANTEFVKNAIRFALDDSPSLSGIPTAPTAELTDSSEQIANTKFVKDQKYLTAANRNLSDVLTRTPADSVVVGKNSLRKEEENSTTIYGTTYITGDFAGRCLVAIDIPSGSGYQTGDFLYVSSETDSALSSTYEVIDSNSSQVFIDAPYDISSASGNINTQLNERLNIAIGQETLKNLSTGSDNIGVGFRAGGSVEDSSYNIAIGNISDANNGSVSLGYFAQSCDNSISLGNSSQASQDAVSVGPNTQSSLKGVSIGYTTQASTEGVAIGYNVQASNESISLGTDSLSLSGSIALGSQSSASKCGVSLGHGSNTDEAGISIGLNSNATNYNIAIGVGSDAGTTPGAIALGAGAVANDNHIAIGSTAYPLHVESATGGETLEVHVNDNLRYIPLYSTSPQVLSQGPKEYTNVVNIVPPTTVNYGIYDQTVLFHTAEATNNFVLNFRGSGSDSLNSALSIGGSVKVSYYYNNGASAYGCSLVQIDGNDQFIYWENNSTPSPVVRGTNVYTFTIVKTDNGLFNVFGNLKNYGAVDPYFSSVSLLIQGNGIHGSQNILDTSSNHVGIVAYGDTQIDTDIRKFAPGCVLFDGAGDYLLIGANSGFNFGTGAFTIEGWIRIHGNSNQTILLLNASEAGYGGLKLSLDSSGHLSLDMQSTSKSSWDYSSGTINPGSLINNWHLFTVSRDNSGNIKVFIDGDTLYSDTWAGTIYSGGQNYIGALNNSTNYLHAHLDDLRITKGIGRYTQNFTPPNTPFPIQ